VGLPVSARVQQKTKDPDDIYFEIKDSEERRKKQIGTARGDLPGWDMSDEERYDEQSKKKKRTARQEQSGRDKSTQD
jgi:hypothetical protein